MSTLQEIENAVVRLSIEDQAAFRAWFAAHDAEIWDAQLQSDIATGKLDAFADEAADDVRSGRSTKF